MTNPDENPETGSMTDNPRHGSAQSGDLGSRKRFSPGKRWAFTLLVIVLVVAMSTVPRLFTRDDMGGRIEPPIIPDSPGVQLVGEVTKTRHYGMFHRGPAIFECGVTVLYEDHRYFFVETTPGCFFRSLIDKTKFPHIAIDPIRPSDQHPISATTAEGAVEEATQFLKNRKEPFDEGYPRDMTPSR
jgi:hypothetical protein